jgi:hypothetical protein
MYGTQITVYDSEEEPPYRPWFKECHTVCRQRGSPENSSKKIDQKSMGKRSSMVSTPEKSPQASNANTHGTTTE